MKLMKPYAALLAAFILALGLMLMPSAKASANNDDVVFEQVPGMQFGDPDIPDGLGRFTALGYSFGIRIDALRVMIFAVPSRSVSRATTLRPRSRALRAGRPGSK